MKRPNRTISILSMSALDVLAMATGVFVLLLVMLMPYYRKTFDANAEIEAARVAAAASLAEVQSLEATAARYRAEAGAAAAEAAELDARAAALEQAARQRVAPQPAVNAGPDAEQQVIEAIDLVFVIDTTASMTPVIRELAVSMRSIVRILQRLVPSVRIGISAYKDRDTGLPPVITFPLTPTDPFLPRIVGFVESLEASPVGSRTIEEDVHLGLEAATLMRWRPDARQVLVVIGDAEAHPEYQNETFWRARNFVQGHELRTLSTLFVTTPSSLVGGPARPSLSSRRWPRPATAASTTTPAAWSRACCSRCSWTDRRLRAQDRAGAGSARRAGRHDPMQPDRCALRAEPALRSAEIETGGGRHGPGRPQEAPAHDGGALRNPPPHPAIARGARHAHAAARAAWASVAASCNRRPDRDAAAQVPLVGTSRAPARWPVGGVGRRTGLTVGWTFATGIGSDELAGLADVHRRCACGPSGRSPCGPPRAWPPAAPWRSQPTWSRRQPWQTAR